MSLYARFIMASLLAVAGGHATLAVAACTQIHNATELSNMRNNLDGDYCLANNIEAGTIANFVPIGDEDAPFTGSLLGNNHLIRNLRITSNAADVGLFGILVGAAIEDVSFVNANIVGPSTADPDNASFAGVLAGAAGGGGATNKISNISVSGNIRCTTDQCQAGGVFGVAANTVLTGARSSVNIVAGNLSSAGGVIGQIIQNGQIKVSRIYATGSILCGKNCGAGGAIGQVAITGTVSLAFATGPVTAGANSAVGGLIGSNLGLLQFAYAEGPVRGGDSNTTKVGGLVGRQSGGLSGSGKVIQSYSVGPVSGGPSALLGGLIGAMDNSPQITSSYWDKTTSGQPTSAAGTGLTTTQLRAALPAGFGSSYGITKTFSYPFFTTTQIDFASPLATLVVHNRVFVFVPIGQLDKSQYQTDPVHADQASLATVYTMLGRSIGITDKVADLLDVKIDKFFWHDSTQTTTFAGPITDHATLGTLQSISGSQPLNDSNVIGVLKTRTQVAILRGKSKKGTHWMLATLFTTNSDGSVAAVVANDPWTGVQVKIDPTTKHVISPAGFPLTDFVVTGFQAVKVQ